MDGAAARRPGWCMNEASIAVRVWDLPTRSFHWLLALCVVASIVSAQLGGNAMVWHFRFGYGAFSLLAFRLLWGVVGGHWSRFATFAYAPATTLRYLRGHSREGEFHDVGHSPLGAFSVFGLIALLEYRDATFKTDDELTTLTGLPVLAVVPAMTCEAERRTAVRRRLLVGVSLGSTVMVCLALVVYTFIR